jgi:hypothetical protein
MYYPWAFQWYRPRADLIWPVGPFKGCYIHVNNTVYRVNEGKWWFGGNDARLTNKKEEKDIKVGEPLREKGGINN